MVMVFHHNHTTITRTQSLLWAIIFCAASTIVNDLWLHSIILSSSILGSYLLLAIINVIGAFLDGYFYAFESGDAFPIGPKTEALHLVGTEIRTFGLSKYTSWEGMVAVAARIAFDFSSAILGFIYVLLCIVSTMLAHGLGSNTTHLLSSHDPILGRPAHVSHKTTEQAKHILDRTMIALAVYIFFSFIVIETKNIGNVSWASSSPSSYQLMISIFFSFWGAFTGSKVANLLTKTTSNTIIPVGTLICNTTFSLFAQSSHVLPTYDASWEKSLILRAFLINFCGAASVFTKHAWDKCQLHSKKHKRVRLVVLNIIVNLLFATIVYSIAFKVQFWLHESGLIIDLKDSEESTTSFANDEQTLI